MSSSIGELAIELGVSGNISELEKAIKKIEKQLKLTKEQLKVNEKLKEGGKKFEKAFKLDKINKQLSQLKSGFSIGLSGSKGVNGLLQGLGQGFKNIAVSGNPAALAIGAVVGGLVALGVITVKAYQAIDRLTESLVADNQQWANLISQTDLAFDKLRGYAGVAGLLDKSLGISGAAGSIKELNDRLFELQLTGEGAKGFQIAGVNPVGQDAFGVLEQVRRRIVHLSDTQASYLLKQLGLDARLLPMLRMKGDEFERLRRIEERYTLTEEQRLNIQQLNIQLEIARQKWQYLKDRAILAIMPYFVRLTKNIAFLVDGFVAWDKVLQRVGKRLNGMNNSLQKAITIVGRLKDALQLLLAPFTWLFKEMYEWWDDLEVFMSGGDSVIGVIVEQINRLKNGLGFDKELPLWIKALVSAADKLAPLAQSQNSAVANNSGADLQVANSLRSLLPQNPYSMGFNAGKWIQRQLNDNKTITQNIMIMTNEAANTVSTQLRYAMGGLN